MFCGTTHNCADTKQPFTLCKQPLAGLLVSIFQHCPQLQGTVMDEVLSQVLPCLPVGRRCPRAYLVGDDKSASIQVTVAMLVQMIQVLPHMHPAGAP